METREEKIDHLRNTIAELEKKLSEARGELDHETSEQRERELMLEKYPELPELFKQFTNRFSCYEELEKNVFGKPKQVKGGVFNDEWRDEYDEMALDPLGPFRIATATYNNGKLEFEILCCRAGDFTDLDTISLKFEFNQGEKIAFDIHKAVYCSWDDAYIE